MFSDEKIKGIYRAVIKQKEPYPHQIAAFRALGEGRSVILRAPTGAGKSEAVFVPFLEQRGNSLPMRMIYALPMRALVNSLCHRFSGYAPHLKIRPQHGDRPESVLFYADSIVATLDQVITSYACAPLSLGIRQGNIPAGAVAASFLVFDEVHTFEPLLGLQSTLILADRHQAMKIPFILMSATLPNSFIESLNGRLEVTVIDAKEEDIHVRTQRVVTLIDRTRDELSASIVSDYFFKCDGPMLVVCNTPDRARALYDQLVSHVQPRPLLIHSRFLDGDRRAKEKAISDVFGKGQPRKHALLIATQVIEVGMDISCDVLLTEAAPVDALIQRAGRCARWGGRGDVVVFTVPSSAPYLSDLVDDTVNTVREHSGSQLTWDLEKRLVNEVLGEPFRRLADPETGSSAMALLSKAAFEGRPDIAEAAVRDALTVEVSLHNQPVELGQNILRLPRCRLHPSVFRGFVERHGPQTWRVDVDRTFKDDYHAEIHLSPINIPKQVTAGAFYIIQSDFAAYSPERGLVLGESGKPLSPVCIPVKAANRADGELSSETWEKHLQHILKAFDDYILPKEAYSYERLARLLGVDAQGLIKLIKLTLLFHDLGKLSENWQKGIGASGEFLAHRGGNRQIKLPPHATVSAYVTWEYLRESWGPILGESAAFAIAHHHSVRASQVPPYKLAAGWFELTSRIVRDALDLDLPRNDLKKFEQQASSTMLPVTLPAFEKPKAYTSYVVMARSLRLADRIATGGCEDAILRYEERIGDL